MSDEHTVYLGNLNQKKKTNDEWNAWILLLVCCCVDVEIYTYTQDVNGVACCMSNDVAVVDVDFERGVEWIQIQYV